MLIAIVGLKLHMIAKWIFRMVHQAFLKDMVREEVGLRVDQLCSLAGLLFASTVIFFPVSFTSLFISGHGPEAIQFLKLLAISTLVYSLFSSFTTRAMFSRKDLRYGMIATLCSILALLLPVLFSFFSKNIAAVALSLLMCETLFALLLLINFSGGNLLRKRVYFYGWNSLLLGIAWLVRATFGDSVLSMAVSTTTIGLLMAILHFRKFLKISI
jgi:hypothetical protein